MQTDFFGSPAPAVFGFTAPGKYSIISMKQNFKKNITFDFIYKEV